MKKSTKILISIGIVLAAAACAGAFLFVKKIRSAEYAYAQSQAARQEGDGDAMLRWLHLAGTRGDARAQFLLASGFETGAFGGGKNDELAAAWYKKAAESGDARAQFNFGIFCWLGRGGVPEDKAEAFRWWKKAAADGNPNAANNLGICRRDGLGTKKDTEKARGHFIDAATKNFADAQFNLGLLYEKEKNEERALFWYEKAAAQGHEAAKKRFERIAGTHL